MTEELVSAVRERLKSEPGLSDIQRSLVIAALEGDAALDAVLDETSRTAADGSAQALPESGEVYLKSIKVRGFRGIGPELHLALNPCPGLTVIAGRNGSGKSSVAEAIELALTGTTYRWRDKGTRQWREHWRNLHHPADTRIRLEVAEAGRAPTTIGVDWQDDIGDVDGKTVWIQRAGDGRSDRTAALGWGEAIGTFRPILSYDELGGMLSAEPSKLYDSLASILGLSLLAESIGRLQARRKKLSESDRPVKAGRLALEESLTGSDDDRARQALELLRTPNSLDELESIAVGTADTDPLRDRLRFMASLKIPPLTDVAAAAETIRTAHAALAAVKQMADESAVRRVRLLQEALRYHRDQGDGPCPVCEEGQLDATWAERAQHAVDEADDDLRRLADTQATLDAALANSRATLLRTHQPVGGDDVNLAAESHATAAWSAWEQAPESPLQFADHLESQHPVVDAAFAALRAEAQAALNQRDQAWAPIAVQLADWLKHTRIWEQNGPLAESVKDTEDWLKKLDADLKNKRMVPIGEQASHIWSLLRQESDIDISGIKLQGRATRRRVSINASVDGEPTESLAVLSQGELHALALALFMPRATMANSPFRFVVLDDPVQAMDPAKIDGLVEVLAELAQTRQVVVMSHDDRLADAVRRSPVPARILDVKRSAGSVVTIGNISDPTARYLSDAAALLSDDALPPATKGRVLPGLLRLATESAARDVYFSAAFGRGESRQAVERAWGKARLTRQRINLAVIGSGSQSRAWIEHAPHRARALVACNAVHDGLEGKPEHAIKDVKRLIADIRAAQP